MSESDENCIRRCESHAAGIVLLSLLKSTGGTYLGPRKSATTGEAAHNETARRKECRMVTGCLKRRGVGCVYGILL